MNMRNRRGERGFMMIGILVLMSALMGVAMSMLDTVDNNVQVVNYARRATYARLAAMSAFNYAAGILEADANGVAGTTGVSSTAYDALNESWHMETHTTAGAEAPYTAFTSTFGNGYFVNTVYDLSGRIPSNGRNVQCTALIARVPGGGGSAVMASITAGIVKTIGEAEEDGVTKTVLDDFTPYAATTSYQINLNTVGQLGIGSTANDVLTAIQSAGNVGAGDQRVIGYRRTNLSGSALALSTCTAIQDYAITRIFSSAASFTAQLAWCGASAFRAPYVVYGTFTSEGYFLIHSKGFLSTAASGATHLAENRTMSVVKRTSAGFTTLYFRWFWDNGQVQWAPP